MSLKHCIKAYTSFFNAIKSERKNLQHFFRKIGNGQKAIFFLFDPKSLGLFKCISPLIKYYMFNEKCQHESSWIVWLKDTAAALMSGTVRDHEEVKNAIVASPPLIWPAIILSTDFTITFPFVLPSQIKTVEAVIEWKDSLTFLSMSHVLCKDRCVWLWVHTNISFTNQNCLKDKLPTIYPTRNQHWKRKVLWIKSLT